MMVLGRYLVSTWPPTACKTTFVLCCCLRVLALVFGLWGAGRHLNLHGCGPWGCFFRDLATAPNVPL